MKKLIFIILLFFSFSLQAFEPGDIVVIKHGPDKNKVVKVVEEYSYKTNVYVFVETDIDEKHFIGLFQKKDLEIYKSGIHIPIDIKKENESEVF